MRNLLIVLLVILAAVFFGRDFLLRGYNQITSPAIEIQVTKEKPLDKYTFEALAKTNFTPSEITFGEITSDQTDFKSVMFYFYVGDRKVTGVANIPKTPSTYPVVVMFRGYIDREKYTAGDGTRRAGQVFGENGFITLAPDFLGYGQSDMPSENPIEERFQTYTTALTLLASVAKLDEALSLVDSKVQADSGKIGIWGHSNGGQIALSVLAISGRNYPTVLWAPVTKPFPYSILYYTDEFTDRGKLLRKVLADFEKDYDVEVFSTVNFLDRITAPLELHQGTGDESVPQKWSDEFYKKLKDMGREVDYFVYSGDDHNFARGNWSSVVSQNIAFYREHLLK